MRILSLRIRGLGPYLSLKLSEEDFRVLSEPKVFLISGEIGAGKTSIFDAVTYALYGEASVEGRDPKNMISHLISSSSVVPEVELSFFLDGSVYRIVRRPPFKGRSESVSLWINGSFVSGKKKEVNARIVEALALEAKQFKRVFLIPQGEYRQLFLAKKSELQSLFENIFGTEFFREFEDFLKERLKSLKKDFEILEKQEKEVQNITGLSSLHEVKTKTKSLINKKEQIYSDLKKLSTLRDELREILRLLTRLIEVRDLQAKHNKRLKTLKSQEKSIQQKEEYLKVLKLVKEYLPFYQELKVRWKELKVLKLEEKSLKESQKKLEELTKHLERSLFDLKKDEQRVEEKKRKLVIFENTKKDFEALKALRTEEASLKGKVKKLQTDFENLQKHLKSLRAEVEELFYEQRCLSEGFQLKKELKDIRLKLEKFSALERLKVEEQEATHELKAITDKLSLIKGKKKALELKVYLFKLKDELVEGEPCPLCGSKEHPLPFNETPEENDIKKLLEEEERLEQDRLFVEKKLVKINFKKEEISKELADANMEKLKEKAEKIESALKKLGYLNVSETQILELYRACEKSFKEKKVKISELEKEAELISKALQEKSVKLAEVKERLSGVERSLANLGVREEDFFKELSALKREINSWEKEVQTKEKELEDAKRKSASVGAKLETCRASIKNTVIRYRELLKTLGELKKRGIIRSIKDLKLLEKEASKLAELEREVESFYEERLKVLEVLKELEREEKVLIEKLKIYSKEHEETLKKEDLACIQARLEEVEKRVENLSKEVGWIEKELHQLIEAEKRLEEIKQAKKEVEKNYSKTDALWKLVSGRNPKGMSFHLFVLSLLSKVMFRYANFYLREFSFGRYSFVEGELFYEKKGIEVFDSYTGTKREVKTLSGGESFIATLALSLGMSDGILSLFRSKPFESLFIDEGFGSLDEATLEKVISVLLTFATKTNRTIGLISHLKELKEKFPVILEVLKDPVKGSFVKIRKR